MASGVYERKFNLALYCNRCGTEYQCATRKQIFCSVRCRQKYFLEAHPGFQARYMRERRKGLRAAPRTEYQTAYMRRYRKKPSVRAKERARTIVKNAVRAGKIERKPCFCGKRGEAHHENYSQPLEVKWLCRVHHAEIHRKWR